MKFLADNGRMLHLVAVMYCTYVLLCTDTKLNRKKFYIGSTKDIEARMLQHKYKNVKTTGSFDEVILVYFEMCLNKNDAVKRELQLKTGFGRGYIKRRLERYLMSLRV